MGMTHALQKIRSKQYLMPVMLLCTPAAEECKIKE